MGFPRGDGHGHAIVFRAVKQCLPGPVRNCVVLLFWLYKQKYPQTVFHVFCSVAYVWTVHFHLDCKQGITKTVRWIWHGQCEICFQEECISDDAVCQAILQAMDAPLICTSVKGPKENEWMIDPIAIGDIYGPEGLDFLVDGGVRVAEPSTIVDMTGPYPKVIREGKGPILPWMVVEDDESRLREDLIASGT